MQTDQIGHVLEGTDRAGLDLGGHEEQRPAVGHLDRRTDLPFLEGEEDFGNIGGKLRAAPEALRLYGRRRIGIQTLGFAKKMDGEERTGGSTTHDGNAVVIPEAL